jgi:hypothetical protein
VLGGSGTALGFAVGGPGGGTVTPQATPFAAPAVLSLAPNIDPTPSIAATPAPAGQPTATPAHKPKPAHVRPTDTLALQVTGSASWVEVMTWNNHVLVRRILHHDQRLAYRQHGLRVVLGNAGAVRMSLHGRPARRAGQPGEVLRFRVN